MRSASRASTLRVDAGTSFRSCTPSCSDRTVPIVSPEALIAVNPPRRTFTMFLIRLIIQISSPILSYFFSLARPN